MMPRDCGVGALHDARYELVPTELATKSTDQNVRVAGGLRVVVGAAGAGVLGTLALRTCRPWAWPGADLPRFRANLDMPYRLYDVGAPGNLEMPAKSNQYDGIEDEREFNIPQEDVTHIFVIGDWGALQPNHVTAACSGWDCNMQIQVANAMKVRNHWAPARYVLNVGDAFYWGGVNMHCNAPPKAAWGGPRGEFSNVWQGVYAELANVPWISCLGNHDYGGFHMTGGWPQQIGYSFINHNWIMPARYYSRKVQHKGYVVEYFVIDSNAYDAKSAGDDPNHNICSQQHNPGGASCSGNDGPANVWACKGWFWDSYGRQKAWLEDKVKQSIARWKIVVTHFPCGYDGSWYKGMYERYGLDLIVTGHRHQQELWWKGTPSRYIQTFMHRNDMGDLPCFVSGGGGGIVSENFGYADYGRDLERFGFFHLTMTKDTLNMQLVATDQSVKGNLTVQAHALRMNTPEPAAEPVAEPAAEPMTEPEPELPQRPVAPMPPSPEVDPRQPIADPTALPASIDPFAEAPGEPAAPSPERPTALLPDSIWDQRPSWDMRSHEDDYEAPPFGR